MSEKKSVAELLREFLREDPTLLSRPDTLLKKIEPEVSGSMRADFSSLQTAMRDGVGRIFASINPRDGEAKHLAVKAAESAMQNSLNEKRRKFIIDAFLHAIEPEPIDTSQGAELTAETILDDISTISIPAEKFENPIDKPIDVVESASESSTRMTVDDHSGGEQIVFLAQKPRAMDGANLDLQPSPSMALESPQPADSTYFQQSKDDWGEKGAEEFLYAENYDQKDTHESSNTILIMILVVATLAVIFVVSEMMS